ncbi:hypothetical protein EXIGLDRAFT_764652 [Exidia glandulosa HHB12029]|uniref:Uncharacterized protein n=1 Tax=Exidia glandulosa HHB12029 TaxID=1314781 RepID=A0A165L195_EXIGL|nr:hypothetical protein EXIGLDRAFT_764652 [Exidia glandulosa HHB12029]
MFTISLLEFAKGALYEDKGSLCLEWSVRGAEVSLGTGQQVPPRPPIAGPKPSPRPDPKEPKPKPKRWEMAPEAI